MEPDDCHPPTDQLSWPPVVISAPAHRRVSLVIDPAAGPATVGDLADTVGIGRRATVAIDGRPVPRARPLERSGLVNGSRVTALDGARAPGRGCLPADHREGHDPGVAAGRTHGGRLDVVTEAGPDCGRHVELGPGRHVVGRSRAAAIRLADPAVELHHAVVDVTDDGRATLTQLAGRVPCRWLGPAREGDDGPDANGPENPSEHRPATDHLAPPGALPSEAVVTLGASRLRVRRHVDGTGERAVLTARPGDPWRRSLQRAPRALPAWEPAPVAAPAAVAATATGAGGLAAAVLSVLGGVVIAVVMRNPLFLVFSAVGLLVAVGSRLSGRWARRTELRQRRASSRLERERFAAALAAQRADRAAYHRAVAPIVHDAVVAARERHATLWARRADHDDAFAVTLGWGRVTWRPAIDGDIDAADAPELGAIVDAASRFDDAPVPTDLGAAASLALVGEHADAVARAVVVQLAVFTGPADWRLVVVTDRPDAWHWTAWLPHAPTEVVDPRDATAVDDALGRLDDGDGRHVVVVTDRADLLANRTGPLRRYLGAAPSVAVVAVVRDGAVPSMCRSVLTIGSRCRARWCPDTSVAATTDEVHAAGLSEPDAEDTARRLAALHDPEDPAEAVDALPAGIGIGALLRAVDQIAIDDPIAVAAAWRPGAPARRPGAAGHPTAVVGATADGIVEVDLVRDGPHALVAGTTGAGKSELLRTLVISLAARHRPDELTFVLIDYKGGATFDACAELPHTVGVVTDLDDHLAARALASLDAELRRRERVLRDAGVADLDSYRLAAATRPDVAPLPRLVVVVDEFAALKAELPGFLSALVGVAQRGRSLGIHLVLATQRPAGVVSDDIRANTNLRIALRLHDRAEATDVVGDTAPAEFARGTPGRAMIRLGPTEAIVFQTATSLGPHRPTTGAAVNVTGDVSGRDDAQEAPDRAAPSELTVLARTIRQAASLCDIEPPARPWLEPLPATIHPAELPALLGTTTAGVAGATVGVVDDPAAQCRRALAWDPDAGSLALIGARGSGTTTGLRTVLAAGPADQHVYVLDARGDGGLDELTALPGCGGVVGRYDAERRGRVLRRLGDELARRQSRPPEPGQRRAPVVLAIDGLAGLLDAVSAPADADEHATLLRILADGDAVGMYGVATLERPASVPSSVLGTFAQRWLFHLDDPADAAVVGLRAAAVPPAVAGRLVVVSSKLEAQLTVLPVTGTRATPPAAEPAVAAPAPIVTLPDDVAAADLPVSTAGTGVTSLAVGLEFTTMRPARLEVPDGEHVLLVGPARSGRTTALLTLAAGWRDAHPDGRIVAHAPRAGSPLDEWARTTPGVEVVDAAGLAARAGAAGDDGRLVFVVDDAERVADGDQAMLRLVEARDPAVLVLAAARPEALRTMYGHWTSVVRRSRLGMAMTTGSATDAELFGDGVARRLPVGARRGLAWVFDASGRHLVQVARRTPGPAASPEPVAAQADERANASFHASRLPVRRIERS